MRENGRFASSGYMGEAFGLLVQVVGVHAMGGSRRSPWQQRPRLMQGDPEWDMPSLSPM